MKMTKIRLCAIGLDVIILVIEASTVDACTYNATFQYHCLHGPEHPLRDNGCAGAGLFRRRSRSQRMAQVPWGV